MIRPKRRYTSGATITRPLCAGCQRRLERYETRVIDKMTRKIYHVGCAPEHWETTFICYRPVEVVLIEVS